MWIYILHYDEVIHHTQHYCGQTPAPPRRFQQHAQGAGSSLTAEFARRGIRFHVGLLGQCSQAKAAQYERDLKNSNNLREYCEICMHAEGKLVHHFKGIDRYPVHELEWFANIKWTAKTLKPCYITHYPSTALVDQLQTQHGDNSVGFLKYDAIAEATRAQRVRILHVDTEPAGYLIHTQSRRTQTITIQQVVVHRDHRGQNYGRALVEHLAAENPAATLHCHVRADLPANLFWEAIGFTRLRTKVHKTSGHTLVEYQRPCFLHHTRKEF